MAEHPHRGTPEGILVEVRITPRASCNEIAGVTDGAVRIRLTAPPVEGAANRQVIAFLAEVLGVKKSDIEIVKGLTSRNKTVRVRTPRLLPEVLAQLTGACKR